MSAEFSDFEDRVIARQELDFIPDIDTGDALNALLIGIGSSAIGGVILEKFYDLGQSGNLPETVSNLIIMGWGVAFGTVGAIALKTGVEDILQYRKKSRRIRELDY